MTELEWIMAMTRPKDNPNTASKARVVDEVLKGWLADLHEFLTEIEWDDNKRRHTGTIMLMCEDGLWKAWVHDRDQKVSGWVTGESWEEVLESVNRALGQGTIQWRADRR